MKGEERKNLQLAAYSLQLKTYCLPLKTWLWTVVIFFFFFLSPSFSAITLLNVDYQNNHLIASFDKNIANLKYKEILGESAQGIFLALDLFDTVFPQSAYQEKKVNQGVFKNFAFSQYKNNQVRIALRFSDVPAYEIKKNNNQLIVDLVDLSLESPSSSSFEKTANPVPQSEKAAQITENQNYRQQAKLSQKVNLAPQSNPHPKRKVFSKPISLHLKNADILSVLRMISRETGYNIISGEEIKGKVNVNFNNFPVDEALETILSTQGYSWSKEGNTIIVSPENPLQAFNLKFIKVADAKSMLEKVVVAEGNLTTNELSNSIIVKTTAENLKKIEEILKTVDVPPQQVLIEARIIELLVGRDSNLGVELGLTNPRDTSDIAKSEGFAGISSDSGATGFYAHATSGNVEAFVEALSTRTDYNLLASPKVLALNHKEAEILVGSEIGYTLTTVSQGVSQQSIQFLEVGTKLKFTPHINNEGMITMEIHPEVSEGQIVSGLPQKSTTEATTQLIVADGQPIVIGGLIKTKLQQKDKGLPILSQIPFLGAFFRRSETINEKKEIIVFITPHIVTPQKVSELQKEVEKIQERQKQLPEPSLIH